MAEASSYPNGNAPAATRFTDHDFPTPEVIARLASAQLTPQKKSLGMSAVRAAIVPHTSGEWSVCRAPQDPGCARLLDVAVLLRGQHRLPCLTILEPPRDQERKLDVTEAYLSAYQGLAWHAFGVVLVLDDGKCRLAPAAVAPNTPSRVAFDGLMADIESALKDDAKTADEATRWMVPEDSREAETLVRLTMNRVLRPRGYLRHVDGGTLRKVYKGFWRGAEADGRWTNSETTLRHIVLECKLTEDHEAPLCQVVDHMAHVTCNGGGGAACVRLYKQGQSPLPHSGAMGRLEEVALVRYLDIALG